jgi:hypothetical protein
MAGVIISKDRSQIYASYFTVCAILHFRFDSMDIVLCNLHFRSDSMDLVFVSILCKVLM